MGQRNSREGSWTSTRQGKAILAGGIITTVVVAAVIVPLGIIWLISRMQPSDDTIYARRGDTIDFDYVGTYAENGTVFVGGGGSNIVIGSNSLIPYLDQQLVGMEPGVEKVIFIPAENMTSLGHDANFETTITKLIRNGTILYPTNFCN